MENTLQDCSDKLQVLNKLSCEINTRSIVLAMIINIINAFAAGGKLPEEIINIFQTAVDKENTYIGNLNSLLAANINLPATQDNPAKEN